MKKTIKIWFSAVLLIFCLALLCSCGGESEQTSGSESDTSEETLPQTDDTSPETDPVIVVPEYLNPLTGLSARRDFSNERPVAVMINNLWSALPQEGISDCDIMYECLVEGGITRLMVVTYDYENIGVIGSVRSSRHYYLDLAQNYDAIYVHAGGSDQAYLEIKQRGINNLDGVNMYIPDMFYRDPERLKTMSYEHTLMTTGEKIAAGIAYKKYRTEISEELAGKDAFLFVEYGTDRLPSGGDATCLWLPYSKYQTACFSYDETSGTYYRFQFEDVPHIDGTTGKQIDFTNILVLLCPAKAIGDSKGHLDITTENTSGEGYYLYGGKYEKITWSKPDEDSPTVYYGADGKELVMNRGKTFISVFPDYNEESIEFCHTMTVSEE